MTCFMHRRNRFMCRIALLLVALALVVAVLPALPATVVRAAGTTYYVGQLVDDGGTVTTACAVSTNTTCTLRDALAAATSGQDTIMFGVTSGIIVLTHGTLTLAHNVTITGPGADKITINGGINGFTGAVGVRVFLVNAGVTATISGLSITRGNAPDDFGGGILNNGTLTLVNDFIAYNNARGGAGVTSTTSLTIITSTVTANTAGTAGGGGLTVFSGSTSITNTTFSGNTTTGAGASIVSQGTTLTATHSTFAGNTSTGDGSGFQILTGSFTFTNSILSGPAGGTNCTANSAMQLVDGGHNFQFPGASCGAGVTVADPLLDPVGLNINNSAVPTVALLPGSPAIDAVPATGAGCTATDARGVTRPQGAACDSGAFESHGFTLTAQSGGGQVIPVFGTSFAPLVVSVTSANGEPVNGGHVTFTGHDGQFAVFDPGNTGGCTVDANGFTAVCPITAGKATALPIVGALFRPVGTFTVNASASGAVTGAAFSLTLIPVVSTVGPASGDIRGGNLVTIGGAGFVGGNTTVTFGTGASAVTVPASGVTVTSFGYQLSVTAPAHAAGTVDVSVTTNGFTGTKAGAYTYGVVNATPAPATAAPTVMTKPNTTPPPHTPGPTRGAGTPTPLPQPARH